MKWYNPLTWFKKQEVPQVKAQAAPIMVRAHTGGAKEFVRHLGRLANLYSAQAKNPERIDIAEEIKLRKEAVRAYKVAPPEDEQQALEMLADAQR